MDQRNWLKNLAEARFEHGHWILPDPQESKARAEQELSEIIQTLLIELEEAVQIFNSYKGNQQTLKLLPINDSLLTAPRGLMLLLGNVQLKLMRVHNQGVLEETITFVKNYRKSQAVIDQYRPSFDDFGGLRWKTTKESIMTLEQLVKALLHHVCRGAYSRT